jgi:hypothetical protein
MNFNCFSPRPLRGEGSGVVSFNSAVTIRTYEVILFALTSHNAGVLWK